jgi:hydrogenase maturation protease
VARVLVAGVGNVLRGDDGFGPAVLAAIARDGGLPAGVRLVDVGIGGVRLVQELLDGYDALIVIDAVDRAGRPGDVFVLEPATPDLASMTPDEQRLMAGDMHQLVPSRIFAIAAALGVLPPLVRIVGCQPGEVDEMLLQLTPAVAAAVPAAAERVREIVGELARVAVVASGAAAPAGAARVTRERGSAVGDAAAAIRRADELLQVLYWLRGERLAESAGPDEVRRFLGAADAVELAADLRRLAAAGLVEHAGEGRFRLTALGITEGGRRFAEEFADLQRPGHGECSDPSCDCHALGPEACVGQRNH